jgi:cyanate permease
MAVSGLPQIAPGDQPGYKWYILVLTALTGALVLAAPGMSMSVLFSEISGDLHLNVVQVGWVWGIGALPGIVSSLFGGAITDRYGPRRVMMTVTFLLGIAIALRGLTKDFASLMVVAVLIGLLSPLISTSAIKACGLWFPRRQWGLANGIFTMGMAFGFLVGSLISATVLSPLLGGWRNVMFAYGAVCLVLILPWYFSRAKPSNVKNLPASISVGQSIAHILKLKNIWLLAIAMLGIGGCLQSMPGYLPLYLEGQGWSSANAAGALSLLHTASLICVMPLTLGSDWLKMRKLPLMGMFLLHIAGTTLLAFASGWTVWAAVCVAGMVRDATMALMFALAAESGTSTGVLISTYNLGVMLTSPSGNQLSSIFAGLPFIFWASLAVMGLLSLSLVKIPKGNLALVEPDIVETEA